MHGDVIVDGRFEIGEAGECAATNALVGDVAKESLDHIQPGGTGGSEVDVKTLVLGQPLLNLGVLVCGVVVYDQMQVLILGGAAIDHPEESQPLLVAMQRLDHREHFAGEHVQRGEQCGDAVAFVVMRHRLGAPALERQAGLGAIQRLYLCLLVATENQGVLWRVQIQANNVLELLDKVLVVGQLEGAHAMGLEAMGAPDSRHAGGARTQVGRQRARAPVRGPCRFLLQSCVHHLFLTHCGARAAWATGTPRILQQALHPRGKKPGAPASRHAPVNIKCRCDIPIRGAIGRQQHNARPQLRSRLDTLAFGQNPKATIVITTQLHRLRNSHGPDLLLHWTSGRQLSSVIYGALH